MESNSNNKSQKSNDQKSGQSAKPQTAITPTRDQDYPEWYQQVIKAADLAENSATRGCMVIKPWGYAIWEQIQQTLDRKFKETGHVNAYFPLLIPKSFLEQEAAHVDGFAKECAVVTHHRLEASPDGGLVPAGELEEPFIIRPTSETIIGASYAKWVQSYRDLPILINQWANVMRWEMRTRMFLRTAEFLWQEGHTAHSTAKEAVEETMQMLDVYEWFAHEFMAMPVIKGEKTPGEKFPGAVDTYTIEAMMQDGKALQAGTSHFLGQNFAKASGIKFQTQTGTEELAWTTSWGVSTRLIGGLIMTHSDDDGLICPPRLAPKHVVIIPIYRNDEEKASVLEFCKSVKKELESLRYGHDFIRVELDDRDIRGGEKTWQHIKKGTPLRAEVGPRDVASQSLFVARRDKPHKEKSSFSRADFVSGIAATLDSIHDTLFERAKSYRDAKTKVVSDFNEFKSWFTPKNEDKPEIHGGFALCHWSPNPEDQKEINDKLSSLKVSARCIPLDLPKVSGKCIFTGKPTDVRVYFAKNY
ncbi:MAG: proline--tRNA ligase [Proteobacteria bacterium]|nr:proline--tRNA ligase [Pseudomonadota bacterium]